MSDTTIIEEENIDKRPLDWPEPGEMHFRLTDTLLGILNLSCDTGYVVRTYEFGFPTVREVTYSNSLDDGNFDVTAFFGPRAVTLDMVLRNTPSVDGTGTPIATEAELRDQLMKFLSPARRPILMFSEHGDSRVRTLMLRGSDAPFAVARPRFNELSASWVAPHGVIENIDLKQFYFTFSEENLEATYILRAHNKGTTPSHWTMTINGDLESPQLQLGNQRLWLNFHVEPRNIVTIDSRSKTVRIGNQLVGYRYLDDQSDWFRIPPGDQDIIFTHTAIPREGLPYAYWQPDDSAASRAEAHWAAVSTTNVTATHLPNAATFGNLLDLKDDPTYGDGFYSGPAFLDGYYVVLGDTSQAWYNGTNWIAGYKPYFNPPPYGAPPWIWTPAIDDDTGEPVVSVVTLTYREAYL